MPKHTRPTVSADPELVLPDRVTIALAELAGAAREGLLALAVGTGLGVLASGWPSIAVWSPSASPSMGPRSPSDWPRARPRTPRSSATCWPGCATAGWRSPGPSWW
jgi:hypothetical protein